MATDSRTASKRNKQPAAPAPSIWLKWSFATLRKTFSYTTIHCNTLESFLEDAPETLSKDRGLTHFSTDRLARHIHYTVKVHPPYLPEKAHRDKLYDEWDSRQQQWDQAISALQDSLEHTEKNKQTLATHLQKLMGQFLTGMLNSQRTLDRDLAALTTIKVATLSPAERDSAQKKLNIATQAIEKRASTLDTETQRAKQQHQWQQKHDQLQAQHAENKKRYQQAQEEKTVFQKENPEKQCANEQHLCNQWQAWLHTLPDTAVYDRAQLASLDAQGIQQWIDTEKNNLKAHLRLTDPQETEKHNRALLESWHKLLDQFKNNNEIAQHRAQLSHYSAEAIHEWLLKPSLRLSKGLKKAVNKLREQDNKGQKAIAQIVDKSVNKVKGQLRQLMESARQQSQALEREQQQIEQALEQTERALASSKAAINNHGTFTFNEKASGSALSRLLSNGQSVEPCPVTIDWPDEDLPETGELYQSQGQRYLAITEQIQIENGKDEATRLNATLVVKTQRSLDGRTKNHPDH